MPDPIASLVVRSIRLGACGVRGRRRSDTGQATAEYVLVLLGAASVALVLLGWLAKSGRIEGLLDQVFDQITAQL